PSSRTTSVPRSDARVLSARRMPSSRLAEKRVCSSSARPPNSTIITPANASVSRPRIDSRRSSSPNIVVDPQSVARAADGLDRVAVQLVAQVAHVDLDDVRAVLVGEVPHVLEQVESAQHLAGMVHEGLQQGELAR